ncbi:tryptophan 2,3-dioxygenase [Elysia marginata]|uniref:Tryptophan 2,3-dioxygenase n=1 Tax=Elysia marginata TaxID=1093978 RepID=A0AAV4HI80_9GAST|nr:tryptophan 2,3-dioxygenase [Elysia marginata]
MTWKRPSSPVTKKFKVQRYAAKAMATLLWDAKFVILLDILPQGQCINASKYCSTLDQLRDAIRCKRPGLLRRSVGLQHNMTPHSANLTQRWLQCSGLKILPHPAHSPDHAPSDFHLLGPLKSHLGDMAFNTEGDLVSARVKYNQQHYAKVFEREDQLQQVKDSVEQDSLFQLVERWLERTPGLNFKSFNFWELYKRSVDRWLQDIILSPAEDTDDLRVKEEMMAEYKKQKDSFDSVLDEEKYKLSVARGERRMSHAAFKGAILISLYHDQPRFNQPSKLLSLLMDIDSLLTKWRYNHVMMVQRMIGSKVGTGGSSGYQYLRSTVSDRYKVFLDLFNTSTFLIPRAYIPPLTRSLKRQLSILCHDHISGESSEEENSGEDNGVSNSTNGNEENGTKVKFEL